MNQHVNIHGHRQSFIDWGLEAPQLISTGLATLNCASKQVKAPLCVEWLSPRLKVIHCTVI